jgi:hypothetical protein
LRRDATELTYPTMPTATDAPGTSYRTKIDSAFPRPGGGSWGTGDIVAGNLQHLLGVQPDSLVKFRVTSVWADLDFEPPPAGTGGYLAMFLQVLGPVLGAAILLHEVEAASRLMERRGTLLTPDEVRAAWVDLREYRRPAHFLMGAR